MDDRSSIEIFLNHCAIERGLAKNTLSSYRRDLEKFLSYLNQNQKTLSSITPSDIAAFLHTLRQANLNESSIARNAVALRSLFAFLAKESGVESIAKEILVPRSAKRLPKALSIDQIATLINSCADDLSGIRDRAILELLYATGARVSEIIALNRSDISQNNQEGVEAITIRVRGKGGKERLVPVGSYARLALDLYLTRSRPVFAKNLKEEALFLNEKRGTRLSRQSAWQIVIDAAKRSDLDEAISPHGFRHSFATHLLDGGADIRVVQELLGHASVTTTQIYTLVTIDKLRESYASAHPRSK